MAVASGHNSVDKQPSVDKHASVDKQASGDNSTAYGATLAIALSSSSSSSAWTAYRSPTTGEDENTDDLPAGPAPEEWLAMGWVDYSDQRRKPYPGESPWYGWCNYSEAEWEAWRTHEVAKAVRLAETGEDLSPCSRGPLPKKVRPPADVVFVEASDMLVDAIAGLNMRT